MEHLITDPVTFTLIPDGEHRLSRPEDLRCSSGRSMARAGDRSAQAGPASG